MKYYLYTHYRQDKNELFYIGIGTKNKNDLRYGYYTRAYNKTKRTSYWKNIINLNPNYVIDIIQESDDYEEIKQEEIRLIKFYGRKDLCEGALCNMTDGGDGEHRVWSKESREKASKAKKGKKMSDSFKEKMRIKMLGNPSFKGKTLTKEHRDNISKSQMGRLAWNKGRILSEEEIQSIKTGIQANKKVCDGCGFEFDTANYTRFHGDKCLIGSIKEYIPEIQRRYSEGHKILRIARELNLKYRSVYKLKENKII